MTPLLMVTAGEVPSVGNRYRWKMVTADDLLDDGAGLRGLAGGGSVGRIVALVLERGIN